MTTSHALLILNAECQGDCSGSNQQTSRDFFTQLTKIVIRVSKLPCTDKHHFQTFSFCSNSSQYPFLSPHTKFK